MNVEWKKEDRKLESEKSLCQETSNKNAIQEFHLW